MYNDVIEEITKQQVKVHDEALEKMFMKFGFTMEYLTTHADEFHVDVSPNSKRYYHLGEYLFTETTETVFEEPESPNELKCKFVTKFEH